MSFSPIPRFKQRKRRECKPPETTLSEAHPEAVHNYVPMCYGVPAEMYRRVLRAERAELYATPDRSTSLRQTYAAGLFSEGRPGVFAAT
jgi:hypothetical protein